MRDGFAGQGEGLRRRPRQAGGRGHRESRRPGRRAHRRQAQLPGGQGSGRGAEAHRFRRQHPLTRRGGGPHLVGGGCPGSRRPPPKPSRPKATRSKATPPKPPRPKPSRPKATRPKATPPKPPRPKPSRPKATLIKVHCTSIQGLAGRRDVDDKAKPGKSSGLPKEIRSRCRRPAPEINQPVVWEVRPVPAPRVCRKSTNRLYGKSGRSRRRESAANQPTGCIRTPPPRDSRCPGGVQQPACRSLISSPPIGASVTSPARPSPAPTSVPT